MHRESQRHAPLAYGGLMLRHRACASAALVAAGLLLAGAKARGADATPPPATAGAPRAATLAETLDAGFAALKTVACEIRKTTRSKGQTLRLLSRVHYQSPDHIHVENVSPSKRRIVADGRALYYHETGTPRGFSRPIGALSPDWLAALRNVPGTAVEHLAKLRGLPEVHLPPGSAGEVRRGYQAERVFVVLAVDARQRLTQITFYKTPRMEEITAVYRYDDHTEAAPGCWIPLRHKATVYLPDGERIEETRRIGKLAVNEPIAATLFQADLFFQDVEFVSEFTNTYGR
jgi:outer membrane lipoprotein-sorting protein